MQLSATPPNGEVVIAPVPSAPRRIEKRKITGHQGQPWLPDDACHGRWGRDHVWTLTEIAALLD